jgi:hypothetical protein
MASFRKRYQERNFSQMAIEALEKSGRMPVRERPWTSSIFPELSIEDAQRVAETAEQIAEEWRLRRVRLFFIAISIRTISFVCRHFH